MDSDFDPQRQAEAAMNEAANSDSLERQRWIQFAQARLSLARLHPDAYLTNDGRYLSHCNEHGSKAVVWIEP